MSSNLKVNTILPSTGTTVAVSGIVSATSSVSIASSCTATTFYGSGANLTGITQTTINSNTNNYLITGTGTANTLQGEANLTFDGSSLDIFDGSNSSTIKLKRHASTASEQAHIGYFSSGLHIETRESTYISLKTNTQERLRIHADGEVECKGGAAGQNALLVTGNYSASNNVDIQTWQRSGGAVQAKMIYKDATTDLHFGTDTSHNFSLMTGGTDRLRLKGDGVIEMGTSIGATSDSNIRLRLGRAGDCYLGIRVTSNDTSETGIKFGDASSEHDGKLAYLHTGRRFRFTVGGNDRIFIEMNGDLKGQLSNANIIGFMGAKTTAGTTNWNDSTNARSGSGHTLLLGTHSNGPGPSLYYHPFTFEYAQRDSNGNMTQLAIPYNGGAIYSRYRYSGSWSGWTSH